MTDLRTWLTEPLEPEVANALESLRRAPDVQFIAVMSDVHLSGEVCVGVVLATSPLFCPQAVGGDMGCGILSVVFGVEASALRPARVAGQVMADLASAVPTRRRNRHAALPWPADLAARELSHPSLEAVRRGDGVLEFATLGSGNHLIELQADGDDRLWLTIHCGSRGVGPAIRNHHLACGERVGGKPVAVAQELAYLADAEFARRWADASRRAMAGQV